MSETIISTYTTRISTGRAPGGGAGGTAEETIWGDGLTLVLGVTYGDGSLPETSLTLAGNYLIGGPDNASLAYVKAGSGNSLIIVIAFDAGTSGFVCSMIPQMYLQASATFTTSGASFAGTVVSLCTDRQGAGSYLWNGAAATALAADQWRRLRTSLIAHSRRNLRRQRKGTKP